MNLRKGDTVVMLAGKDRGKRGSIDRITKDGKKVVIAGLNLVKRHVKPSSKYPSGGIIEMAMPIDRSNIMLVNADTDQAGRVSLKREGKTVTRVFKDSNKSKTTTSNKSKQ